MSAPVLASILVPAPITVAVAAPPALCPRREGMEQGRRRAGLGPSP